MVKLECFQRASNSHITNIKTWKVFGSERFLGAVATEKSNGVLRGAYLRTFVTRLNRLQETCCALESIVEGLQENQRIIQTVESLVNIR